jgi:hypothetical protein
MAGASSVRSLSSAVRIFVFDYMSAATGRTTTVTVMVRRRGGMRRSRRASRAAVRIGRSGLVEPR